MIIDFGDGMRIVGFPQMFGWDDISGAVISVYVAQSRVTVTEQRTTVTVEGQACTVEYEP